MNRLIEYEGIASHLPEKVKAYKQFIVKQQLSITDNRFGIRDIIKVVVNSNITNRRIIKTAEGYSLEGIKNTGLKYLIKGFFDFKIYYEENSEVGLLGFKKTDIKFYTAINLDKDFMSSSNLISNIYIEDIYSDIVNEREFFLGVTATVIVEGDSDYE